MPCAFTFHSLKEVGGGLAEHAVNMIVEVGLEGTVLLHLCEPLSEVGCCFFSGLNEAGVTTGCSACREVVGIGDEGADLSCQAHDAVSVPVDCDYSAGGLWFGGGRRCEGRLDFLWCVAWNGIRGRRQDVRLEGHCVPCLLFDEHSSMLRDPMVLSRASVHQRGLSQPDSTSR